ncbi:putative mannosyltransferase OCH1-like protein [Golden Marseillevirus]|uniref:putative mannosyltransferase OCH1-like protein n=1 Tax=Golden Marseillevirus TaxID=1720526 RepID=UPI000877AB73|nr:putative mannosyltransferase OCH1-like protein [Golden Marseillevirus]ALX27459.1 putative mannosyltransferase OCH1-like protein [Golden Marseillevirus]
MKKHKSFLKEMPLFLERAARTGKPMKMRCRNSYERKLLHEAAENLGLSHRSILDYTEMHKNYPRAYVVADSGCCPECDTKEILETWTPYSWVEVNNGNERNVAGTEKKVEQTTRNVYRLPKNIYL